MNWEDLTIDLLFDELDFDLISIVDPNSLSAFFIKLISYLLVITDLNLVWRNYIEIDPLMTRCGDEIFVRLSLLASFIVLRSLFLELHFWALIYSIVALNELVVQQMFPQVFDGCDIISFLHNYLLQLMMWIKIIPLIN